MMHLVALFAAGVVGGATSALLVLGVQSLCDSRRDQP